MTQDKGVRDMPSFLIARDTKHQNQWLAAIQELEEEGFDETPVPNNFPQKLEKSEVAYGKGKFTHTKIKALTIDEGQLSQVDPHFYGTPATPIPAQAAE